MLIPAELLQAFPPSATGLLDVARRDLDDELVMWIASADYGYMADEFFLQLQQIRDTGQIPRLNNWLGEVLELTRFANPECPTSYSWGWNSTVRRVHQGRLFACAVLLAASAEPALEYYDHGEDSTLALCATSAVELGGEYLEGMGSYLTWQLLCREFDADWLWHAISLLAVAIQECVVSESIIGKTVDWILDAVQNLDRVRDQLDLPWHGRPASFGVQQGFWVPVSQELLAYSNRIDDDAICQKIRQCRRVLEL